MLLMICYESIVNITFLYMKKKFELNNKAFVISPRIKCY